MNNTQRRRLTDSDVETVRRSYADGSTMQELADAFGVSKTTIFRVVNDKCYRWLDGLSQDILNARYRESRAGNGRRGAEVTNRRRLRGGVY